MHMSIYGILSTDKSAGFIEVVLNATTAAKIQKVCYLSFVFFFSLCDSMLLFFDARMLLGLLEHFRKLR